MTVGQVIAKLGVDPKEYEKGLKKAEAQADKAGSKIGSIFKNAFSVTLGVGMFEALKKGFKSTVGPAISFNSMLQTAQIGFATMLGSAEKAQKFLDDMADFAIKTPFEYPELLDAAKRMLAYGFAAEEVLPVLRAVGDASAALGSGSVGIDRITLALGQIRAKGKLSAEEMRQLTEAGVPAWHILAEAMGKTVPELQDMVSKGLIPGYKAVEMLTAGMTKRFGGMMASMENTWQGVTSSIKDTWRMMVAELTQAWFQGVNAWLIKIRDFLQYIYMVIRILLGKKAKKSTDDLTAGFSNQAGAVANLGDSYKDAGKAAKKAAKDAQTALMGFDEINRLSKETSSGAGAGIDSLGGAVAMPKVEPVDMTEFADSMDELTKKAEETALKIQNFFRNISDFLANNKTTIIASIAGIVGAFAAFQVISNWTTIVGFFPKALTTLGTAIAGISAPILAISALIGLFIAAIVDLWQTNEEFRDNVTKAWNGIKDTINNIWQTILKPVWDYIKDAAKDIWDSSIKPLWENFKNVIKNLTLIITDLWNNVLKPVIDWVIKNLGPPIAGALKLVIETVKQAIKIVLQVVNDLMSGISDVLGGIRKVLSGLIDFITGVFTGNWKKAWEGVKKIFSGIMDSLKGIVKAPLNFIIDAVNTLIRGINKFKINIPDWVANLAGIKAGYFGFNIPTIPRLAQGGIITSPTLAMIGEAGDEAVMPLERNTGWIDILASKLASAMQGVQLAGAGGDIYVYIGNEQVDAYIYRSQDRRNIRSNGR